MQMAIFPIDFGSWSDPSAERSMCHDVAGTKPKTEPARVPDVSTWLAISVIIETELSIDRFGWPA